jgi:hypothetical protein
MLIQSEEPLLTPGRKRPIFSNSKQTLVGILREGNKGIVPESGQAAQTLMVNWKFAGIRDLGGKKEAGMRDQQDSQRTRFPKKGHQGLYFGPKQMWTPRTPLGLPDFWGGLCSSSPGSTFTLTGESSFPPLEDSITTWSHQPLLMAESWRKIQEQQARRLEHLSRGISPIWWATESFSLHLVSPGSVLLSRRKGFIICSVTHWIPTMCQILCQVFM